MIVHEAVLDGAAIEEAARAVGLTVLAQSRWPQAGAVEPEPLPGFVYSSFGPLVAATAGRCLAQWNGPAPVPSPDGGRMALILVSVRGDVAIARAIAQSADTDGGRISPLPSFQSSFQSVANAVLGHIASVWGIGGPLLCTGPAADPDEDALALAAGVLALGDADTALIVRAEPACADGEQDWSYALLARPAARTRSAIGRGA